MKVRNPMDHKWYYFVDKCMPFRSSISYAHFQAFSDAISFVTKKKSGSDNVNYLDDFLFIALLTWACNNQVKLFMKICEEIQFPVALDKTCWATTIITFLEMLLNTVTQTVSIPQNKISKAIDQIQAIVQKKSRKASSEIVWTIELYLQSHDPS